MKTATANINTLAYANLEIAPDNPDAFDISSVKLNVVEVNTYPMMRFFTVERRETEYDSGNYHMTYDNINDACESFRKIIEKNNVKIVKNI